MKKDSLRTSFISMGLLWLQACGPQDVCVPTTAGEIRSAIEGNSPSLRIRVFGFEGGREQGHRTDDASLPARFGSGPDGEGLARGRDLALAPGTRRRDAEEAHDVDVEV